MVIRIYKTTIVLLLSIHFVWTFFLIAGFIFMLLSPAYAVIQLIVMSFTLLIAIPFGNTCPLTLFEEKLRQKIEPTYHPTGGYVVRYINKIFKTHYSTRSVDETLTGMYIIAFATAISIMILRGYGFFR